jgi:preprotein translocase subunit SecG
MTTFITTIHIIICFILILAVLLQSGKSADLAGAFGGAGSQSTFGPRGAQTILSKMTTISAVLFMFTSFGLWILSGQEGGSVLENEKAPITEKAAATYPDTKKKVPEQQPDEKKQAVQKKTENKNTSEEKK